MIKFAGRWRNYEKGVEVDHLGREVEDRLIALGLAEKVEDEPPAPPVPAVDELEVLDEPEPADAPADDEPAVDVDEGQADDEPEPEAEKPAARTAKRSAKR